MKKFHVGIVHDQTPLSTGRRDRLKGARGRGTLEKEKPPIFGIIQQCGQVVIQMRPNVRQATIGPLIKATIQPGTLIYTDEYAIYDRLDEWGYGNESVNHGAGKYAGDDDGRGFYEVHVNTMEGSWSLLRSRIRPHRGISQEKLPFYLGFFEFVHNVGKRGKSLLHSLIEVIIKKIPKRDMSLNPALIIGKRPVPLERAF